MSSRIPRRITSIIASATLMAGSLTAIATTAVVSAPEAQATNRITQQTGFNARAWTVTQPDANGIRYVGGDFTSYKAWDTGNGAAVDSITGAVDPSFPKVSSQFYADVVIPDGSGGWFVGGSITSVGGTGISRVAHINADGSLDTNFSFSFDGGQAVLAMARDDSTLLIGGSFSAVDGQPRTNLAALDITTGTVLNWAPNTNGTVEVITVQDETVYIGGNFTTLAGQTRNDVGAVRLGARTNTGGTCLSDWDSADCLTAWNPNSNGWAVVSIVADDTSVWLGGWIDSIGGQARSGLGKVDAVTGVVDPWNPVLNAPVEGLALDGGTLYVGGQFTSASGQNRNRLAAYDTMTNTLLPWDPDVTGNTVKSIKVSGGLVYVAGLFQEVGGQARNHAAAVSTAGTVDAWDPHVCNANNGTQSYVYSLAVDAGKVYLLGNFPCVGGQKRLRAAAVNRDGLLAPWAPRVNGPVFSFSRLGSTIYMVGNFSAINGVARQWAGAADTDGNVTAWNPSPGGNRAEDVIATPTGVYLSGFFSTMGNTARMGVARVDTSTGALDTGFDANVNSAVRAIWLEGNRLFLGGDFTSVGNDPHDYVAVVDASTGAVETGFNAATGNAGTTWPFVEAIAVIGDRAYLGGEFGSVNGDTTKRYIAAVDSTTGTLDNSWAGTASRAVYALAPSPDGSTIFAGGNGSGFSSGSGTATGVGEFDAITGALTSWRADTGEVRGLSASDAAVFLAGNFGSVGGQGRQNTAAVDIDGNVLDPWPMDPATSVPLSVAVTGSATGAVVSAPGGINCGASCDYAYTTGSSVTLTAVPAPGANFRGWTGDCSGSGTSCTVSVAAARSAVAEFVSASTGGGGTGGGGSTPAPVNPPAAPRDIVVTSGDEVLNVSWQAPTSQGSFPVTTYRVTAQPGDHTCLTTDTSCELTGLTNDVSYTITVSALSGAGWSAESTAVTATPLSLAPTSISVKALPRTPAGRHDRIAVVGAVSGLTQGMILRPYLQIEGKRDRLMGKARVRVAADGTVRWQRKIRPYRDVTVYFMVDGVKSNTVTWQRIR